MNTQELILKSLITLIFAILTGIIIPYIKSKIDADKMTKIEAYAAWAVRCAEQILTDNKVKREFVIQYITDKAQKIGLELTDQDISNLVEYTVNLIKYGQEYTRTS